MPVLEKYQNKRVAVYGMGLTGLSAAKKLKLLKAEVFCWDDSRKVRKKINKLKFKLNKFWLKRDQNGIDFIVLSPGIDINKCKLKNYLKKNFKKIITDLDLFFELNNKSLVISITGTNGKSTTCKIIEKILRTAGYNANAAGNIGKPILSLRKSRKKRIFILEISSYQLQYSKIFRSKYTAILNITPDHLERHQNIRNYILTKSKIFYGQKKGDCAYINKTDKYARYIKTIHKNKKLKSKLILINKKNCNLLLKKSSNKYFKSEGYVKNLAFAYNIVKKFKIRDKIILRALNKFKGLPHRQEIVFSNKKLVCINDSKATSFDACSQSLSNYDRIYWIVGGLPKYGDRFNLRGKAKKIVKAYIIGKSTSFFSKQIAKKIPYAISKNLKNAIRNIDYDVKKNKYSKNTILFSPAAASFDQFNNFEDRGNFFKNLAIKKFKRT